MPPADRAARSSPGPSHDPEAVPTGHTPDGRYCVVFDQRRYSYGEPVTFTYTNWRGETAVRRVVPIALEFKATDWHPERQWLLQGEDVEKGEQRYFAMKDIRDWNPASEERATP